MRRPLAVLLFLSFASFAFSAFATGDGPVATGPRQRLIKVLLADVQRLPEIPREVIDHSRFGPIPADKELLAAGNELDRRFVRGEPIVRSIDGTFVASLWDEAKNRWMTAGFEFVAHDGLPEREPLLHLVEPDHSGASLACDFEFVCKADGANLTLREVVALDPERIYLAAESRGRPVFLSARYSFQKAFPQS
jgi:hypothetical protein